MRKTSPRKCVGIHHSRRISRVALNPLHCALHTDNKAPVFEGGKTRLDWISASPKTTMRENSRLTKCFRSVFKNEPGARVVSHVVVVIVTRTSTSKTEGERCKIMNGRAGSQRRDQS